MTECSICYEPCTRHASCACTGTLQFRCEACERRMCVCKICNRLVQEPIIALNHIQAFLVRDHRPTMWDRLTKNKRSYTFNRVYKRDFPAFQFLMELVLDYFLKVDHMRIKSGNFYICVFPCESTNLEYQVRYDFPDELSFLKDDGRKRCLIIYKP